MAFAILVLERMQSAQEKESSMPSSASVLKVDIWSDIVCPFCFIGRQHLNLAIQAFQQQYPEVTIQRQWRSFELDPQAPAHDTRTMAEILSQKYGRSPEETRQMMENTQKMARAAGLEAHLEGVQRINTFALHCLLHLAKVHGLQDELKAALMHAYFVENRDLSQESTRLEITSAVGLDPQAVQEALQKDTYAQAVRQDQQQAQRYGIQGVPFFVFNDTLAVSGAQPVAVLTQALIQSVEEAQ